MTSIDNNKSLKDKVIALISHYFNESPLKRLLLRTFEDYSCNTKSEFSQFSSFLKFLIKVESHNYKEKMIFLFALFYHNIFAINFLEHFSGLPERTLYDIIMSIDIDNFIDSLSIKHRVSYYLLLKLNEGYDKDLIKKLKISKKIIKKYSKTLLEEGFITYN